MAHARIVEIAKGDGNCAFNAFVLGLVDPSVLNNLQPSAEAVADDSFFVINASQALGLETVSWNDLKAHLLSDTTPQFRLHLQKVLAPLLREIAIGFIVAEPQEHLARTKSAIQAELEKYFIERITQVPGAVNTRNIGDIFIRHRFIQIKFEELYQASPDIDAAQAELGDWWATPEGQATFLNDMAHPAMNAGDTELYAGDLELAPLGAYFGASVSVHSEARGINKTIYHASSPLPLLLIADERDGRALADLGITTNDSNRSWTDLSLDDLTARLNAVPQFDELMAYIQNTKPMPKIGDVLPPTFGMDCLVQLGVRGILNSGGRLTIDPAGVSFVNRVVEFATKDRVIQAWTDTYRPAPVVALQNEVAAHWNNLQPVAAAELKPAEAESSAAVDAKESALLKPEAKTKTTPAAPYQHTSAEREVNDAVNQAFDLLNKNRPPLSDAQVAARFDHVFNEFSSVLDKFKSKKIDMKLFKQEKKRILSEVSEEVKLARKQR
jgi:hypothetical protein